MGFKNITLAMTFLGLATSAHASSISFTSFSVADYNAQFSSSAIVVTEDFETFGEGNVADGFSTAVGTFSSLGGTGSGGTVTGADFANDGSQLAVRDGDVFGRTSTTSTLTGDDSADKFLDSNDTFGISWLADLGGTLFNRLVLTLTDAADTGATLEVTAAGETASFSTTGNGNVQIVVIDFAEALDSATIDFGNLNAAGAFRINDGFSLDDIAISTVPVPAGLLLMGTALAGLGMVRRRAKA